MRHLPPLNALRVFDAAARNLSFTAAADELCVTHSAVSHQIRQLEAWLGRALFVRHAGGVRLTEAGQRLQATCGQALEQLEKCCAEILARDEVMEITLGAPGSFLANWLIPRLEAFEAEHPQLRIRLQTSSTLEELQRQRLDAQIITGRAPWPRQLAVTPMFDERIGPVCAPDWAPISRADDLLGQPLLQPATRRQAWRDWALVAGLDPAHFDSGRAFDHLPLLLEAAAAGLGVAIAPAVLVEREISRQRLIAPLGFVACGSCFAFCVQASRAQEAGLLLLRDWLVRQGEADKPAARR